MKYTLLVLSVLAGSAYAGSSLNNLSSITIGKDDGIVIEADAPNNVRKSMKSFSFYNVNIPLSHSCSKDGSTYVEYNRALDTVLTIGKDGIANKGDKSYMIMNGYSISVYSPPLEIFKNDSNASFLTSCVSDSLKFYQSNNGKTDIVNVTNNRSGDIVIGNMGNGSVSVYHPLNSIRIVNSGNGEVFVKDANTGVINNTGVAGTVTVENSSLGFDIRNVRGQVFAKKKAD